MAKRALYLVAYDVRCPERRRRALGVVKGYAAGRQQSVFECYLTARERRQLRAELADELARGEDAVLILRLRPGTAVRCLGRAEPPLDPNDDHLYIG